MSTDVDKATSAVKCRYKISADSGTVDEEMFFSMNNAFNILNQIVINKCSDEKANKYFVNLP